MNLLLKILAFRSFQISQVIIVMAVLRPLGCADGSKAKACQYCSTVGLVESKLCTSPGQESRGWQPAKFAWNIGTRKECASPSQVETYRAGTEGSEASP